jgi:hypothetical protein
MDLKKRLDDNTLNGNQEEFGFIQKRLLSFEMWFRAGNCLDFEEEETLLQSMRRKGNGSTC